MNEISLPSITAIMKKIGSIFIALLSLSSFAFGIEDLNFNQVILGPNQKSYYD